MITDTYNRHIEAVYKDNGVIEQGGLSKKMIMAANANSKPTNSYVHAPAHFFPENVAKETKSFASMVDTQQQAENDDNPISREMVSDGLGALFGAATGLDYIEMLVDYGCDATEFRDDYICDRYQASMEPPAPQPDPRLWMQPSMPMPAWASAA